MPNTKPDLSFDAEGVCDACRSAELKNQIDWEARRKEFEELVGRYRGKNPGNYDCIVPVSGGKDSTYQVWLLKEVYKMNPLLVCFEATHRTELGKKNLANINHIVGGADMIEFHKNRVVYDKMCLEGFRRVGDNEWPNHVGIFTVPVRLAVALNIPLIVWGENSQLEYGGPKAARMKHVLNRRWLEEFGGLLGHRVEDMLKVEGITERDLVSYVYPSDEELEAVGVNGVFLGYYFKWDARAQLEIIKRHGFSVKEDGPVEGTYTNYENLDDHLVAVHDYLKFVKFGFGRATDHACLDIRNGRMSREEGVKLVQQYDGKYPKKGAAEFIEYFGISKEEFDRVIDSFTDKSLFELNEDGSLKRDTEGNLIKKYQVYTV